MRLREETGNKPKPLLSVGYHPILWHIMKHYSSHGFNDFILCLGYQGNQIKDYFIDYNDRCHDIQLNIKRGTKSILQDKKSMEDWNIIFANTGLDTNTGGRIKRIERYINGDYFFLTYGDGLSDVDLKELEKFFLKMGKTGVITGIRPQSRFGRITMDDQCLVTAFKEKPVADDCINGGFAVFHRSIFSLMDDNCVLEQEVFTQLVNQRELAVYKHQGFWKCMDTYKDYVELNEMWEAGDRPWEVRPGEL